MQSETWISLFSFHWLAICSITQPKPLLLAQYAQHISSHSFQVIGVLVVILWLHCSPCDLQRQQTFSFKIANLRPAQKSSLLNGEIAMHLQSQIPLFMCHKNVWWNSLTHKGYFTLLYFKWTKCDDRNVVLYFNKMWEFLGSHCRVWGQLQPYLFGENKATVDCEATFRVNKIFRESNCIESTAIFTVETTEGRNEERKQHHRHGELLTAS